LERGEYQRLAVVEERGWWFWGLQTNLIAAWRRIGLAAARPIVLDAGCGTGGLLMRLARELPHAQCIGLDLDQLAASTAQGKSNARIVIGSTMALPFSAASLDAVFSADVLCHRGVEPKVALQSIRHSLKPGGVVVLNLPAYRWLFSGHDRAVDNVRRFGRREVRVLLDEQGFVGVRTRYWNSLLFPLMMLQRLTHPSGASDVKLLPSPVERIFRAIVEIEAWLGARGLNFPFGGSILATAVKP
jgi:SAM-dependent methyltransferase